MLVDKKSGPPHVTASPGVTVSHDGHAGPVLGSFHRWCRGRLPAHRNRARAWPRPARQVDDDLVSQAFRLAADTGDGVPLLLSLRPDFAEFGERSFKYSIEQPHRFENFAERGGVP